MTCPEMCWVCECFPGRILSTDERLMCEGGRTFWMWKDGREKHTPAARRHCWLSTKQYFIIDSAFRGLHASFVRPRIR